MSRTHGKWIRPFIDGYEWSGVARQVGTLGTTYDAPVDAAFSDGIRNIVMGQGEISAGPINAFFSPTGVASGAGAGFHDYFNAGNGTMRNLMIAIGKNAEPVAGDPMFAWNVEQKNYYASESGYVVASIELMPSGQGVVNYYSNPWGVLLHANSAETAVNSAVGIDDFGAATTKGGLFAYQLLTSNGTVTLKAQDAATNTDPSFADITGATSGSIDASATPKHGFVALATTATVRRYLRWQYVLGTATTATFLIGLIRNQI